MNTRKTRMGLLLFALSLSGGAQAGYTFTDLGTLGGTISQAFAINNSGQVVGGSWTQGDVSYHATIWNGTTATDLTPGVPGWSSEASDINIAGHVAGDAAISLGGSSWGWRAAVWNGADMTVLGTLGGTVHSGANAINSSGQVAGYSHIDPYHTRQHATVWNGTTPIDLGIDSTANDINDAGQVVGTRNTIGGMGAAGTHATVWNGTTATDLGTLGGSKSIARAINNSGLIVGYSWLADDITVRATLWDNGVAIDLGTLGGSDSSAGAINMAGAIVGASYTADGKNRATLWQGTVATDLNTFLDEDTASAGWVLTGATGINDNGWITGIVENSSTGEWHAYLLTPVPEPETYAMMLAGLALVGVAAKRRRE